MPDPNTPPAPGAISAVIFPIGYKSGLGERRTAVLDAEARAILKAPMAYGRHQTTYHFVTAHNEDCLAFPTWHEHAGKARYSWVDRGDGVKLGTLVEGAHGMVGGEDPRPAETFGA